MPDTTARRRGRGPRARRPQPATVVRLHFSDPGALLDGFARAQEEPWVDDCHADVAAGTLDLRPSPSFGQPGHGAGASWQTRMRRIAGGD